ncbi:MAG: YkvA family protein [Hylemonella sp.]|nr:YkvA family protein [Hylemonella sp.]
MAWLDGLKQRARALKAETYVLYLAARHPGTPWYAKLLVAVIVAYAFSPIDLIPDFVPVLGYLDDLVLLPLGIVLVIRLLPPAVLAECRVRAQERLQGGKPVSRVAAAVIVAIWLGLAALGLAWGWRYWNAVA